MTREELYKAAKSKLHEDFCLNGKCSYYDQCERGEGHVPAHKLSCNHDFALSMIIKGVELAINSQKSPWISVKDYLPSMCKDLAINAIATKKVIVLLNDGRIRETQLICGHWKEYDKKVTHWMPIPELPKE